MKKIALGMEQTAADDLMSDAVYHQPVNFEMIAVDMMGNMAGNAIVGGMNKLYQDHQLNKDWNPYLKKQVQAGMNPVGTYLNNVDAMANNVAARTWWQNTSSANDQSWQ